MIVHRVKLTENQKAGRDPRDPSRLIRYITGEKGSSKLGKKPEQNLVNYATGATGNREEIFTTDGERILAVGYQNMVLGEDPEAAIQQMRSTASLNNSVQAERFYEHIILSSPEGELLEPEQLIEHGKQALAAIGYDKHEAVFAVHDDTDNRHLHIVASRVDPVSSKIKEVDFILDKLHYAVREIEIENNLEVDEGIYVNRTNESGESVIVKSGEYSKTNYTVVKFQNKNELGHIRDTEISNKKAKDRISRKAELMEVQSGRESFETYVQRTTELYENEGKASTWQEFHALAGKKGINVELNSRKNGVLFSDAKDIDTKVSGSSVSRQFSKTKLEKRFGKFEAPTQNYSTEELMEESYDKTKVAPRFDDEITRKVEEQKNKKWKTLESRQNEKRVNTTRKFDAEIFAEYKEVREQVFAVANEVRKEKMSEQRAIERQRWTDMNSEFKEIRKVKLKGLKRNSVERKEALTSIDVEKAARIVELQELKSQERKKLYQDYPAYVKFPTFKEWLNEIAENNVDAASYAERFKSNQDSARLGFSNEQASHKYSTDAVKEVRNMYPSASMNLRKITFESVDLGDKQQTSFFRNGQTVFTDVGSKMNFHTQKDDDLESGILLANQKARGTGIEIVSGTPEFQEKVRAIAAKHNIKVNESGSTEKARDEARLKQASYQSKNVSDKDTSHSNEKLKAVFESTKNKSSNLTIWKEYKEAQNDVSRSNVRDSGRGD